MCSIDKSKNLLDNIIEHILEKGALGILENVVSWTKGGYEDMNIYFVTCLAFIVSGAVAITFRVTNKNVKRHTIEFICGKFLKFKTDTEFI